MINTQEKNIRKELMKIPGVGKSIAGDLIALNILSVEALKNKDPEIMYRDLCDLYHSKIDRCMLYVFRCAVYFAENTEYNPELLKWWNWKD